jgi:hypothetical protein
VDVQVEVDASLIAAGFDGPAFGNAALREVIDRDAMVVWGGRVKYTRRTRSHESTTDIY